MVPADPDDAVFFTLHRPWKERRRCLSHQLYFYEEIGFEFGCTLNSLITHFCTVT
jgi:hypothetical protein